MIPMVVAQTLDGTVLRSRSELKREWGRLWAMVGDEDVLPEALLHFEAGTPVETVMQWFHDRHAEITRAELPLVEISYRRMFGYAKRVYEGREVVLENAEVVIDGLARPELAGKTVTSVKWLSSRGTVKMGPGAMATGLINGVMIGHIEMSFDTKTSVDPLKRPGAHGPS